MSEEGVILLSVATWSNWSMRGVVMNISESVTWSVSRVSARPESGGGESACKKIINTMQHLNLKVSSMRNKTTTFRKDKDTVKRGDQ